MPSTAFRSSTTPSAARDQVIRHAALSRRSISVDDSSRHAQVLQAARRAASRPSPDAPSRSQLACSTRIGAAALSISCAEDRQYVALSDVVARGDRLDLLDKAIEARRHDRDPALVQLRSTPGAWMVRMIARVPTTTVSRRCAGSCRRDLDGAVVLSSPS